MFQTNYSAFKTFRDYGVVSRTSVPSYRGKKKEDDHKNKIGVDSRLEYTCRMFPPLRKAYNVFEGWKTASYLTALGMGFRFFNEFTEDWHDIKNAFNPKYKHRPEWQFPFPMIKYCPIEKTWIGKKLAPYDRTLFETEFFQKFLRKIGMSNFKYDKKGYIKIKGNKIAKTIGEAGLRVPLLGAGLFSIMEIDDVIKAKNKPLEVVKSAIRIVCIMGGAAILGRIGRFHSKLLDLAGLGGGVILGGKLANKINATIFPEKENPKKKLDVKV